MFACLVWIVYRRNILTFALLWLVGGFVLVLPAMSSHFNAMGFVIEPHWLYFNSMGFCLLCASLIFHEKIPINKDALIVILAGVCLYMFILTKYNNSLSATEERYYEFWLRTSPGNVIARENLASLYIWDENASVEEDLLIEMQNQVLDYSAKGMTKNAAALLQRIQPETQHP